MKLPTSIENILNENIDENQRLELKKNWNPEPILHTICAFANDIDKRQMKMNKKNYMIQQEQYRLMIE